MNCLRQDLPLTKPAGIHRLAAGREDEDSETSSSDSPSEMEDRDVNYIRKCPQVPYKIKKKKKYQGWKIHAIVEEQRDQINALSKQMSELIDMLKPSKNKRDNVDTLNRNTEYPKGAKDINNSEDDNIFHNYPRHP